MRLGIGIVLLIIGGGALFQLLSSNRLGSTRTVDLVQLIAGIACLVIGVVVLLFFRGE